MVDKLKTVASPIFLTCERCDEDYNCNSHKMYQKKGSIYTNVYSIFTNDETFYCCEDCIKPNKGGK